MISVMLVSNNFEMKKLEQEFTRNYYPEMTKVIGNAIFNSD
jgi:hypothetical protein